MIKDYNHPSIFVYCSLGINEMDIEEILWGIEEEGIPFILKNKDLNDAKELANLAANDSKLSVGIGINNQGDISLTIDKLKEEDPLFFINLEQGCKSLRSLGANGARLVKGMPLKNI
ncbi:glycerol dehydratase reactivase beta/small subunit family protein [Clostridium sp. LIBA-8841]|uniref:glycerol dehydratase reactivase beta/small subunit family protein n=1 Tax=Clostridium sp. LIBA-8841 TaxID=2987530 RepID=UPI002AC69520|nr:glycerol dehydratase reactivase beta/small subunit family protein [Clostridium sp. LIBA-8841]EGT3617028.1 glycerol dehydratase [Clostridium perfringens]MDZ5253482.1 glycerol dehydratase reactivase beta/small subunit family protein [Clostridium sp. LIBA-8841]